MKNQNDSPMQREIKRHIQQRFKLQEKIDELENAILNVRVLHLPIPPIISYPFEHCHHCKVEFPCPTIKELDDDNAR